ncbi:exo-beta-1,3-glucanase [Mycena filopes]|nr:exo-beta-1,3-glucanase [Mycena filopes]
MNFVAFSLYVLIAISQGMGTQAPLGISGAVSVQPANSTSAGVFWLEAIKHQGKAAYNEHPDDYQVFRNVKDFGAKGDGVSDDTAAINNAISSGNRCGAGCNSSTVTPALVYFPQGVYLVSQPIIAYYYTQLIGDAKNPPTLLAAASFVGMAVVDADPYIPGGDGAQWYQNQNNLIPATTSGTCLHWQVAQATSLMNITFRMSNASDTVHQGIWMENGSGGFMGDLVFDGGAYPSYILSRRHANFPQNVQTAIQGVWAVGWIGFDLLGGVGAEAIIDATVTDTPIFVRTAVSSNWQFGNVYMGNNPKGTFTQGSVAAPPKPSSLLDSAGHIFGKMHPQYADHHVHDFVSVRDHGATGDGKTDDTYAINEILSKHASSRIIFFDAGTYIVTSTITIPAGARIVGEAWSVISGSGPAFQDQNNPQVVVRWIEITDMIFSTVGPAPGAIVVEWNIKETEQGSAGAWDTHIRLGGAAGTNLEIAQCLPGNDDSGCMAAFMALHLTRDSTAYLEGLWVWAADHTIDEDGITQLNIFSGRGILSESQGPVWMIGTASEHHTLYQYNLVNSKDHFLGFAQTETPYFQPLSTPLPYPFITTTKYSDPVSPPDLNMAWGIVVQSSSDIMIFGAGLYSFYTNYSQACLETRNCQNQILNIHNSLATVASTFQISVDGKGIVDQADNNNGFASTVTVWMSEVYRIR